MEVEELATLRKLLLMMVDDPRVFLIKIADRLHNMRTMYAVNTVKGKFVANETLQARADPTLLTPNSKLQTPHPKPETLNSKPRTPSSEPRNPKL